MNGIIEITGAFTNSFAVNIISANDGLSKSNPTTVVLGQDFGAVGDPGRILTPREIPLDPGTFIEMRAGTAFSTGGQSIIGIANDSDNSFQPFGLTIAQISANDSANIVLANSTAGNFGPRIQFAGEQASGTIGANGTNATYPTGLANAFGMGMITQHNMFLKVASRILGHYLSIWGDDGLGSDQEYYRFLAPINTNLDFGNTAAQTSSELTVAFPGVNIGYKIFVSLVSATPPADCFFNGYVSAVDVVTVRFNNYSAAAIDPANLQFVIGAVGILP